MKRKAFSMVELIVVMLVSSVLSLSLSQITMSYYKLQNKINERPVNSNMYIHKSIESDFNKYPVLNYNSNLIELQSSEECSLYYFYDNDTKILEKYTDCNTGDCVESCNTFKQELKSFELIKETENVYALNIFRKDLKNADTFKISKLPILVN